MSTGREYLFVIDDSKARRSAIAALFCVHAYVRHCRTRKLRNILVRSLTASISQTEVIMKAICKLPARVGMATLKMHAVGLRSGRPDTSVTLLEGLDETFTEIALGLAPPLMHGRSTTSIIENTNGEVRRSAGLVKRYRHADTAVRRSEAGSPETRKQFRKIPNVSEPWILAAALKRLPSKSNIGHDRTFA